MPLGHESEQKSVGVYIIIDATKHMNDDMGRLYNLMDEFLDESVDRQKTKKSVRIDVWLFVCCDNQTKCLYSGVLKRELFQRQDIDDLRERLSGGRFNYKSLIVQLNNNKVCFDYKPMMLFIGSQKVLSEICQKIRCVQDQHYWFMSDQINRIVVSYGEPEKNGDELLTLTSDNSRIFHNLERGEKICKWLKFESIHDENATPSQTMTQVDMTVPRAYNLKQDAGEKLEEHSDASDCMREKALSDDAKVDSVVEQLKRENKSLNEELARLKKSVDDEKQLRQQAKISLSKIEAETQRKQQELENQISDLKQCVEAEKQLRQQAEISLSKIEAKTELKLNKKEDRISELKKRVEDERKLRKEAEKSLNNIIQLNDEITKYCDMFKERINQQCISNNSLSIELNKVKKIETELKEQNKSLKEQIKSLSDHKMSVEHDNVLFHERNVQLTNELKQTKDEIDKKHNEVIFLHQKIDALNEKLKQIEDPHKQRKDDFVMQRAILQVKEIDLLKQNDGHQNGTSNKNEDDLLQKQVILLQSKIKKSRWGLMIVLIVFIVGGYLGYIEYQNNLDQFYVVNQENQFNKYLKQEYVGMIDDGKNILDKKNNLHNLIVSQLHSGLDEIDSQTGILLLETSRLFDGNSSRLTTKGKQLLKESLLKYSIGLTNSGLLQHLSEIAIEGYDVKDSESLHLSEKRAFVIYSFWLDPKNQIVESKVLDDFKQRLTVYDKTSSRLIYSEDGSVDKNRSRRIEIKFRLNDEQTLEQLSKIINRK